MKLRPTIDTSEAYVLVRFHSGSEQLRALIPGYKIYSIGVKEKINVGSLFTPWMPCEEDITEISRKRNKT